MATNRRRIKIVRPKLQMKLTLTFVGLTLLALMMQFMIFLTTITGIAVTLPSDHDVLMDAIPEVLLKSLLLTFCVVLPLVFLVGVADLPHRRADLPLRELHQADPARREPGPVPPAQG
jgi:hypothetical protein